MIEKTRVLLTDDKEVDMVSLVSAFNAKGMKVKLCSRDGAELLKLMSEFEPDVIIMDMFMKHIDGLGVLARINQLNPVDRPLITVSSCVNNDMLQKMFLKEGADYCFIKPVDAELIAERIMQMISWKGVGAFSNFRSSQDYYTAVSDILHQLGIPAKIKGFRYIRDAIVFVIEHPTVINKITTVLYPYIAEKYESDAASVERSMRYAIKIAWDNGNEFIFKQYFLCVTDDFKKPTNSEFIARLSDELRYKRKMNMQLYEADI